MKKAIAIMAYNRIKYFELVLPSILMQKIDGRPVSDYYDIYAFQDGIWEGESAEGRYGHQKISELLRAQSGINFTPQTKNLGVAFHFDFAEKLLFMENNYEYVSFCEDDMILAPNYMSILNLMYEKFKNDDRVGMMSANPDHMIINLNDQRRNFNKYASMGHNWAFAMTKKFWIKRQPFVSEYLNIIDGMPYRQRPHQKVRQWLIDNGFKREQPASSQDYIKCCAAAAWGVVRISTYGNYGLPIGRIGLHYRPDIFKEYGLESTVICDVDVSRLNNLDDQTFHKLLSYQQHEFGCDADYFDFGSWRSKYGKRL